MKTSQQGLDLLIAREGKRNDAYLDSVGVWTIGVGHTGPEVHDGLHWPDEQVEAALAKDLERFEAAINDNVTVGLEQYQFDALVSWLFNVGAAWASKPARLIRLVNENKLELATAEFDQWHIPPEITRRRNGEREQFKGAHFVAQYP
jgi:lysozyme